MNYLHYDFNLSEGDIVEVTLNSQANVRLLDNSNYFSYQRGDRHTFYGGLAKVSPVVIKPPYAGHWHLVIDLGGYSGTVKASVRTLKER